MNPSKIACIVEWNDGRGFGWLDDGGERLFLHIRDFVERSRPPKMGDRVTFVAGVDFKGRPCAKGVEYLNKNCRITIGNGFVLALFLVLPGLAACLLPVDVRFVAGYAVLISGLTYAKYSSDKRRARHGDWRVPESTLHWLELIGGWPGAFLAQRRFRHKVSKPSFQRVFWAIVILYQLVAFDFLADWQISQMIWTDFQSCLEEIAALEFQGH